MQTIQRNEQTEPNLVVYGPPGSGKSYAITTFRHGKILVLQTEPGMISALQDDDFKARVDSGEVVVLRVESWKDIDDVRFGLATWVEKHVAGFKPDLVVVDSISWVADYAKDWVLRSYPPKNVMKVPELQQWMMIAELMRQFIQAVVRSECAVYFVAQADMREVGEPGAATTMWVPGIPGKYATKIGHDVDVVFFSRRREDGTFVLDTFQSASRVAKVRGFDPARTIPFDLDAVIEMWRHGGKG